MSRTRTPLGLTLASVALAACASLDGARTATDVVLLDAEFEQANRALDTIAFNDTQRNLVEGAIDNLARVREQLKAIAAGHPDTAAEAIVIRAVAGEPLLDEIAASYQVIKSTYLAHLDNTGQSPDWFLTQYSASAENVYDKLATFTERQGALNLASVSEYLAYVLRGYAVYRSGGLAPL